MNAVLVALSLGLLISSFAEEKPAVDVAFADAKRNAQRPGGQAFQAAVGKAFGAAYGSKVSECAKRVKKPDLRDFELLVKLSINGRIEDALVRPDTNLAVCLREELTDGSLPAPETNGYWVRIGLKLKR